MKYLKTAILENFQSHKYSVIHFDEGLNVILGPSDSGKSAIIRAIKWALYNEPAGDYFMREGESKTSVTLLFSDNTKVKRLRTRSKNQYILYLKDGEEIILEGFGTSVPEEILEATDIKKIKLDSDSSASINLGEQLEGPFLLSEKTSTRAGAIGRLIGVNIIDDALKDTLKDIRNLNNRRKMMEERISKIQDELKEYDYLDQLEKSLEAVENLRRIIAAKTKKKEILNQCLIKYESLKGEISQLNQTLDRLKSLEDIDPIIETIDKNINSYKYLRLKNTQYKNSREEIKKTDFILDKLTGLEEIDQILKDFSELNNRFKILYNIKESLTLVQEEKSKTEGIYHRLRVLPEIEKALTSAKDKPQLIKRLIKLKEEYALNQKNLRVGNEFIRHFDGLGDAEERINQVAKLKDRLRSLMELSKRMKATNLSLDKETKELERIEGTIKSQLNEYREILSKIEVCPFCLSHIDEDKRNHIISHYI